MKIRGHRIEPGEIEQVLQQHPAVHNLVVSTREDTLNEKRIVGYVVFKPSEACHKVASQQPIEQLRKWARAKLPDYMIPSMFVQLDELPLTANGKVDRKNLPDPQELQRKSEQGFEGPTTPLQEKLCKLWEEVLQVGKVGIRDNFFELGGHSILAARFALKLEREIHREIPVRAIFQAPTVCEFSELIERRQITIPGLVSYNGRNSSKLEPLFCIHYLDVAMRLAKHLTSDRPVHGIEIPLREPLRRWGQEGRSGTSIEEFAEECLKIIQRVQPVGPYHFVGHCFGGLVAVEVGRLLNLQGESVRFLGLVDSLYSPGSEAISYFWLKRWSYHAKRTINEGPGYFWRKLDNRIRRKKVSLKRSQEDISVIADKQPSPTRIDYLGLLRNIQKSYKIENYPGSAVLFRAVSELTLAIDPVQYCGWDKVIRGELSLENIVCRHEDIIKEPNVRELANLLETHLEKLNRAG